MRRFIRFSLVGLLLVVALAVSACAPQKPAGQPKKELGKIRVGYLPTNGALLVWTAIEEGYFKDEGLTIEPSEFAASGKLYSALQAGQLDLGQGGIAAPVAFIANGADFKIVGGTMKYGAQVMTRPERAAEFKTMADFKGKTVGTIRLATGDVVWRYGLYQAGIDWKKDVTIKEFQSPGDAMTALKEGHVDAAVLWEPFGTIAEQQGNVILKWTQEIFPHPCCRVVVDRKFAEANPDLVVAYLKGLIRAQQFVEDPKNQARVLEILKKYLRLDEATLKKSSLEVDPKLGNVRIPVTPEILTDLSTRYIDMMAQIGYISPEGAERAKSVIDEKYIIKAYMDLGLAKTEAEARRLAGARAQ